jgi:CubicO group peptidase (beta-lactamase class C family)
MSSSAEGATGRGRRAALLHGSFPRLCATLAALALLVVPHAAQAYTSLDALLTPYLTKYEMPAVAAAVVKDGQIIAAGAVGTRRVGTATPVTINDAFHIGSDTKAMTALLAAMLVEEGKLRWETTAAEAFPELAARMDPRVRRVTLAQLLSHTSGIPSDNDEQWKIGMEAMSQPGNLDDMRYWLVTQISRLPLRSEPGAAFAYANMGYITAGAMIERAAKTTWEELVTQRIFLPLDLRTAGLGPQSSMGRVDAPLAHAIVDGKIKAMLAGPNGDNPAIAGPAGAAHMSILDFARWAAWNAGEGKHGPALVKPETLRKLHTPVIKTPEKKDAPPGTPKGGEYAYGWGRVQIDWSPSPLLSHAGSNTMNLAHIWLDPKHDFGMVIASNIGGGKADAAFRVLARELYEKYGK